MYWLSSWKAARFGSNGTALHDFFGFIAFTTQARGQDENGDDTNDIAYLLLFIGNYNQMGD